MTQRSIFITGAAAGIGRETALLFAEKGWFVGLFDVDRSGLDVLAGTIGHDRCCAMVGDVCDEASVGAAVERFGARTGGVMNVLFNNAGIIRAGAFDAVPPSEQRRIVDINVWGVINCTLQALPMLKASTPARIINMSSASAVYGHPQLTAYAASKMAVRSLTQGLDVGLRRHGIQVCDLMPIWVRTGLVDTAAAQWGGLNASAVRLTPETIARYVWKAAHSRRLHWRIGWLTWYYHILSRVLPEPVSRLAARVILRD